MSYLIFFVCLCLLRHESVPLRRVVCLRGSVNAASFNLQPGDIFGMRTDRGVESWFREQGLYATTWS